MRVDEAASEYVSEMYAITAEVATDGIIVIVRIERPNAVAVYLDGFNAAVHISTAEFAEMLVKWAINPPVLSGNDADRT